MFMFRFMLEIYKSRFMDFQKIRIQEVQAELPRGCIPRSVEIILRAEAVESAHAGDRCEFTGTLIVVPDVGALNVGVNKESDSRHKGQGDNSEGVRGLKSLGVRDLHYRMAFLACGVQSAHKNRLVVSYFGLRQPLLLYSGEAHVKERPLTRRSGDCQSI